MFDLTEALKNDSAIKDDIILNDIESSMIQSNNNINNINTTPLSLNSSSSSTNTNTNTNTLNFILTPNELMDHLQSKIKDTASVVPSSRHRLLDYQTDYLNYMFQQNQTPKSNERQRIAQQLNLSPRTVQVWFQNRRAKLRKNKEKQIKEEILDEITPISYITGEYNNGNFNSNNLLRWQSYNGVGVNNNLSLTNWNSGNYLMNDSNSLNLTSTPSLEYLPFNNQFNTMLNTTTLPLSNSFDYSMKFYYPEFSINNDYNKLMNNNCQFNYQPNCFTMYNNNSNTMNYNNGILNEGFNSI